jgi:hypothetical protein
LIPFLELACSEEYLYSVPHAASASGFKQKENSTLWVPLMLVLPTIQQAYKIDVFA